VPGKNIRPLCGRPAIAYAIAAARGSRLFERVVVTTDSPEIAAVARESGAEVPFLRPPSLADDQTPVSMATVDALERLDPDGRRYSHIAQLLANCPLCTAGDVKASYQRFITSVSPSQISVARYGWQSPWWAMRFGVDGTLQPLFTREVTTRSQDLPVLVCPTGAIWWAIPSALRAAGTFHIEGRTGWEIEADHAVDIDTEDDWALAELLMERRQEGAYVR
jgi:pseudaminic acid cytidylyltransferase